MTKRPLITWKHQAPSPFSLPHSVLVSWTRCSSSPACQPLPAPARPYVCTSEPQFCPWAYPSSASSLRHFHWPQAKIQFLQFSSKDCTIWFQSTFPSVSPPLLLLASWMPRGTIPRTSLVSPHPHLWLHRTFCLECLCMSLSPFLAIWIFKKLFPTRKPCIMDYVPIFHLQELSMFCFIISSPNSFPLFSAFFFKFIYLFK